MARALADGGRRRPSFQAGSEQSFRAIPSATGGIARLACDRLREAGRDVPAVAAKAGVGIEALDDPAVRLEVRAQIDILDLAAAELGDDLLGFHLARSFDLREIGLAYYIMASSEQLADALRNAERYSRIANEGVRLRFSLDRTATIALDYVDIDRRSDRHQVEFWLVALMRICRQVTETRLAPRQLTIRHAAMASSGELGAFFGHDVEFGAGADAIVFPGAFASLPIVRRDVYLNRLLRRYAEDALAAGPNRRTSIRAAVEEAITQLLPHGRAHIAEVARQLGLSSRTLSRKLREQGVSFAGILSEFRAALAKRYLAEGELPVSEIAWLLGYRELSSMTHAFKRWTGLTPREFRVSEGARD
ncbi:MAG TPA: AraC family transcriptional regulator ligand-binding domain-containing protein [Bradyrhizobium sp.]|nr:AraC family transcriptional regulator ligand-binding domain-containing protein [Bradyrhizobium sp.]